MSTLEDPQVRELLEQPNFATISTLNADGTIHSTVVWVDFEDGQLSINSAVGRKWPTNLQRDPRVTLTVPEKENPYRYAEIRGRARATSEGAEEQIDRLAKKYIGQDRYPWRQPGEERIRFVIEPERVRHQAPA
jgi:PPOX class probable F420-dependent enzyme